MARSLRPHVIISEDQIARLERLAEGLVGRNPELADRLMTELARARIAGRRGSCAGNGERPTARVRRTAAQ